MHKCVCVADDLTGGNATGVMISNYGYDAYAVINKDSIDVNNMSEQEIKEANTQSNVFIAISLKVVDAMEDIVVSVEI